MTTSDEKMWLNIEEFLTNTVKGYYSAIYKFYNKNVNQNIIMCIQVFNVQYFNDAYKSLILRNDPYITNIFDQLHSYYNHSYICLLNITFILTNIVLSKITIEDLDLTNYTQYMKSVSDSIEDILKSTNLREKFVHSISHVCDGIDIKKCNPNEDMFYLR